MKKTLFILVFITFTQTAAIACDICGCGIGNNYIGILPEFNRHIIGLRYRQNSMLTHVGINGAFSYLTTREIYRTSELWAGWNIGSGFRLMASVPYNFNERNNQGNTLKKNGLGDISIAGFLNLVNSRKAIGSKLLVQSLWVGAGIKAPTGSYNPVDKANTSENANLFQLGTGSTDFTLNAMYDLRVNDAGISTSALYKINTGNKYDYRYGNKMSINAQIYYKIRIAKKITLAPNAGAAFDIAAKDKDENFPVDISGGHLTMGTVGFEFSYNKMSFGSSFQTPLAQNLADRIVFAKNRGMIHLSFLL